MPTWFAEIDGCSIALSEHDLTIGRSRSCGLPLADPSVSRVHAVISRSGEQFVIQDLGSTNGTYLNGARLLEPRALCEGDSVVVGETEIQIHARLGTEVELADADLAGLTDEDSGSTAEIVAARPSPSGS